MTSTAGTRAGGDAPAVEPVRRVRRGSRRPVAGELGHQPALDGLRALAVAAVLVYHARFEWAGGGFLGVSTFFTLSGFLITSLLLREWARHGALDLRRFWSRRFRRLLPASWLTLGLVLAMGAAGVWTDDQLRSLRGDVPWALAELVNWHYVAQGREYGAGFEAPSPIEHYWSLAIEQQFYLVFPLVVGALLAAGARRGARGRRGGARPGPGMLAPLVAAFVVVAAASAAYAGWRAADDTAAAYFSTPARLAELLVGALLAVVLLRGLRLRGAVARRVVVALGVLGLAGSLVLWHVAAVPDGWLYPWGLLASAACTAALVAGAVQGGVLTTVFAAAPLVWVGRVSYGVYLLHWPVFLWLTPERTGWSQWPLFALRLAVTFAAAVLMYRLLEHPVRSGARLRGGMAPTTAVVAGVALLGATWGLTRDLPPPRALERAGSADSDVASAAPAPLRVLAVGDELAASLDGLEAGGRDAPVEVTAAAAPGCGLAVGGYVRLPDGTIERDRDRCGTVRDTWAAAAAAARPDVIAVWAGLRDVADRRFNAASPWVAPGEPSLDDFLRGDVGDLLDRLAETGAQVVVLTTPHLRNSTPPPPVPPIPAPPDPREAELLAVSEAQIALGAPPAGFAENDDARIDRWNALLAEVAAARGVPVLDVAGQMRAWPGGELDPERRAGGVGLTEVGAEELGGWLATAWRDARPAPVAAAPAPAVAADAPLPEAPPPTPRRTVPAGRTARVLVVGDSVAYNYGYGLGEWARGRADVRVVNAAQLGCAVARGGTYRYLRDIVGFGPNCEWAESFPRFLSEQDPDVVLLSSGIWEVVDRRLPGDSRFRSVGEAGVDRYLLREWLAAVDTLAADGATVVLATYPYFEAGKDQGFSDLPESDPARVDRLNEIIREVAALRPGVATVLEVPAWLDGQPGGQLDPAKRDDGLHFADEYAPTIAAWMGPELLRVAREGPPPA